jgi:hypothetical protein
MMFQRPLVMRTRRAEQMEHGVVIGLVQLQLPEVETHDHREEPGEASR